jgi:outer membrane receptor protein involved in Fe transport
MRFTQVLCGTASAVVLAGLSVASVAQAQEADTLTVDSIVVTAQKREQNLQDVPVVVTAVGAKLLQDTGVKDIKDLTILTPGLTVTSTTSEASTTARVRGVGTVGDNPGLESSVGVVIDGVYRPRNGVSFGDLGEMERIEVLKGPQGTLFGKNTSAGVINVVTKEPEFGFGATAEATIGNFNAHGLAASVTGPLFGTETLAGRLYVAARERDGYNDVVNGKGPSDRDQDADQGFYTVRGQLLFVPNDEATFKIIADYTKRDENCCGAVQIRTGPTAGDPEPAGRRHGPGPTADPYARVAYSNRGAPSSIEDKGVSLEGNIDLPIGTLTSISAIRNWRTDNGQDSDFTTADLAYRNKDGTNYSEFTTFTQELRLAGKTGKLDWLVGTFLADEKLETKANFLYGNDYEQYLGRLLSRSAANPAGIANFIALLTEPRAEHQLHGGQGLRDSYNQRAKTVALFTNNTWQFTDAFEHHRRPALQHRQEGSGHLPDHHRWRRRLRHGSVAGRSGPHRRHRRRGGHADRRRQPLPALGQPAVQQPRHQPVAHRQGMVGHGQGGVPLLAGSVHLRLVRSRLQGRRLQPRPHPVVQRPAKRRPGRGADLRHLVRRRVRRQLRSRREEHPVQPHRAAERLGFYQKFTDFQLNTFLGTSFAVRSIPEVTSQGVDADFLWFTPVRGLMVQSGLTYAKTQYGDQKIPNDPTNALALLPGSPVAGAQVLAVGLAHL